MRKESPNCIARKITTNISGYLGVRAKAKMPSLTLRKTCLISLLNTTLSSVSVCIISCATNVTFQFFQKS
jgi:hypothetical protein